MPRALAVDLGSRVRVIAICPAAQIGQPAETAPIVRNRPADA